MSSSNRNQGKLTQGRGDAEARRAFPSLRLLLLRASALNRVLIAYLACSATLYVVLGLSAIWFWGWRELFADQWRLYKSYLGLPFLSSILVLENGHRPILPGIVRIAEIHLFHGNQRLQLLLGALLAFATFALIAWRVANDRELSAFARACGVTLAAVAIFWLANMRTLLHGNESVQTYLVTTSLCGALLLTHLAIDRLRNGLPGVWARLALASIFAVACTFSFGTGLGAFAGVAMLLLISRTPVRYLLPVATAMIFALALYFALPGGSGQPSSSFTPLLSLRYAAQWLSSPAVYLLRPFLDFPSPKWPSVFYVDRIVQAIGWRVNDWFGPMMLWVWPQALIGFASVGALFAASVSVWRKRRMLGRAESLGLGLAWFGVAVAVLIGFMRKDGFQAAPEDVYAYRYVVWPCVFWLGMGLIGIGWRAVGGGARFSTARMVQFCVIGISVLALPAEMGWWRYARNAKMQIDQTSAGLVVGVLDKEKAVGETGSDLVLAALPLVRDRKVSMFGWPVADLIGKPLPQEKALPTITPAKIGMIRVENLLPAEGYSVRIELSEPVNPAATYLLLVDGGGTVVGLAVWGDTEDERVYFGYAVSGVVERMTVRVWPD